jgi:SAM-dependent methyltransferase
MDLELESIKKWFDQDIKSVIPPQEVLERYHAQHPRAIFMKTLPAGASLLDVGAGDGGYEVFRRWPAPARPDIKLFAYSLDKGTNFDKYDSYELGNWDLARPAFGGMKFDAIYSSHFIEHINERDAFFSWCASRLNPGGRIYVEWPSDASLRCPTMKELAGVGFGRLTGNFYDDLSHTDLPATEYVLDQMKLNGLTVDAWAVVHMPVFESELLQYYRKSGDLVSLQFAYWLRTGWCQFVTAFA